jgi:hypothetical protein
MGYYNNRPLTVRYVRPPSAIRDNTKARRAWLQEELAKLLEAGEDAKITGQGSYQSISVKIKKEVKTRTQLRGFCQGCGGRWAMVGQSVSHHGYERPGWGYQTPSCVGARSLPLSESNDVLVRLIRHVRETIANLEKRLTETETADTLTLNYRFTEGGYKPTKHSRTVEVTADTIDEIVATIERMAREEKGYVEYQASSLAYEVHGKFDKLRKITLALMAQGIKQQQHMLEDLTALNERYLKGEFVGTTIEEEVPV